MMLASQTINRILVVDDEEDICANVSDILSDMGYACDTARNGPAALDLVRSKTYDLALLDYKMPGMDGLTLCREIRKVRPETIAMLVTAFAGSTTGDEARNAGFWKTLRKPVEMSELIQLVDGALKQPLVLVVDDDRDFCESLSEILRENSYRVCVAHNEAEAIHRIDDPNYQVAVVDLKLGDGDGVRVIEQLRLANPSARTIVITGFRSEMLDVVEQLRQQGVDAICYKPLDLGKLLSTIELFVA